MQRLGYFFSLLVYLLVINSNPNFEAVLSEPASSVGWRLIGPHSMKNWDLCTASVSLLYLCVGISNVVMFHSSKFGTQAGQKLFGNQQLLLSPLTCRCTGIFLCVRGAVPSQTFQENHDYKPGGESQATRRDGVTLGASLWAPLRSVSPALLQTSSVLRELEASKQQTPCC